MHSALRSLLVHQVQLGSVSVSAGGARTPGPVRTVRARIDAEQRLVRDRNGRETASSTVVFLEAVDITGAAYAIGLDDRLTLPAGFEPQAPPIISVCPRYGTTAALDHYEVRL